MRSKMIWCRCECGETVTATWLDRVYEPSYYVDAHHGDSFMGVCRFADDPINGDNVVPRSEWEYCPDCGCDWELAQHTTGCCHG